MIIACNTAHLILDDLQMTTGLRFHSLIDATIRHIGSTHSKTVGIIASPTTIRNRLYEKQLDTFGTKVLLPTAEELVKIERIIRSVIAGQSQKDNLKKIFLVADRMRNDGADKILLGCTELSVLNKEGVLKNSVDPLQIITEEVL